MNVQYAGLADEVHKGRGKVPVADYKLANYLRGEGIESSSASSNRGCYSFCMCPGGQVVSVKLASAKETQCALKV